MPVQIPFQYHPLILEQFPGLSGFAILGTGLSNFVSGSELNELYLQEQLQVKSKLGSTALSEIPSLAAWRAAFRHFGVDPTQYRCAAEALLRRLQKKGDIPSINPIVDACNLISIRYSLPVAAINLTQVKGYVTVQFANGSEHFNPLGEDQPGPPLPGEVIFMDEAGLVLARRWCWRQSVECAAESGTHDLLVTIESQDPSSADIIEQAGEELMNLLKRFVGGEYMSARIV